MSNEWADAANHQLDTGRCVRAAWYAGMAEVYGKLAGGGFQPDFNRPGERVEAVLNRLARECPIDDDIRKRRAALSGRARPRKRR